MPDLHIERDPTVPVTDSALDELEGRRLVDIAYFMRSVKEVALHQVNCRNGGYLAYQGEIKRGLKSMLKFKCAKCSLVRNILTTRDEEGSLDVNRAAVWGISSTGGGYDQLQELFASLDMTTMGFRKFSECEKEIGDHWKETLAKHMHDAALEEYRIAIEKGHVDSDGIPYITVICDGSWSTRSHGHRYSANSGMAVIIGFETKKLLFLGVRNKCCTVCDRAEKAGETPKEHECFMNWKDSSPAMEADIICEGFQRSVEMYQLRYLTLIGDGDSNVISKIRSSVDYGRRVNKIECANHCVRNYTSKLFELHKKDKELLNKMTIKRLTAAARGAINHNSKQVPTSVSDLADDIRNGPRHVFGDHTKCKQYYCKNAGTDESKGKIRNNKSAFDNVIKLAYILALKSETLIHNATSNLAEHCMSLIAKHIGGKQINRSQRGSYTYRCHAAGLSYQLGKRWHVEAMEKLTGRSVSSVLRSYADRREKKNKKSLQYYEQKGKQARIQRRLGKAAEKEDAASYGPNAQRPDMTDAQLEVAKKDKLDSLRVDKTRRDEIEKQTRGQNNSTKWKEERNDRLTASNFGKVCKMLQKTSRAKLVRDLLYKDNYQSKGMLDGIHNESVAAAEYTEKTRKPVTECGLFVDLEKGYLGASPDRLLDDDGLVEIKCITGDVTKNMTIHEVISLHELKKTPFYLSKNDDEITLKRNHDHYYQVQGQLNITGRNYCDFVVRTEKDMHIERINKDETFWKENMLPHLCAFYENCFLLELADPRKPRSMENEIFP